MTHKIAFYLPRMTFLKVFGPLIDHLLDRERGRFEALVLLPRWTVSKTDQQVDPASVRSLFGPGLKVVEMGTRSEFVPILDREAVEAVLCLTPVVHELTPAEEETLLKETRAKGIKWVSLPGVTDELFLVGRYPKRILTSWDLICTIGTAEVDWAESFIQKTAPQLSSLVRKRLIATGHPEFDDLKNMDREAIRNKYDLPRDKPIIFLSTACASRGVVSKDLAGLAKRGLNIRFRGLEKPRPRDLAGLALALALPGPVPYRRHLSALRELADRNGAVIVAKSRTKHDDPDYVRDYVDHFFREGDYYPFLTLELMAVSSLYFGFQSACSLEAMVADVYAINVLIYNMWAYAESEANRSLKQYIFSGPGGFWNLPGRSRVLVGADRSTKKELARLAKSQLSELQIDPEESRERAEALLGYGGKSSARVVQVLADMLG